MLFRFKAFKEFMGVPEYLPGTKLERQNSGPRAIATPSTGSWSNPSEKPKIYNSPRKKLGGGTKKKAVKALDARKK